MISVATKNTTGNVGQEMDLLSVGENDWPHWQKAQKQKQLSKAVS